MLHSLYKRRHKHDARRFGIGSRACCEFVVTLSRSCLLPCCAVVVRHQPWLVVGLWLKLSMGPTFPSQAPEMVKKGPPAPLPLQAPFSGSACLVHGQSVTSAGVGEKLLGPPKALEEEKKPFGAMIQPEMEGKQAKKCKLFGDNQSFPKSPLVALQGSPKPFCRAGSSVPNVTATP